MEDNTTPSGQRSRRPKQALDKNHPAHPDYIGEKPQDVANGDAASAKPKAPLRIPVLTKGQKYVAPTGRHSQQTHRRAEERAAMQGHSTEKEQHVHDRGVVSAELNRQAELKLKQQGQNQRNAAQKASAPKIQQESEEK